MSTKDNQKSNQPAKDQGCSFKSVLLSDSVIPYYINTNRLLDLYAIQNNRYSEYVELSQEETKTSTKKGDAKINTGIKLWKLFNVTGSISGGLSSEHNEGVTQNQKIVQTAASMLNSVLEKAHIGNISKADDNGNLDYGEPVSSARLICIKVIVRQQKEIEKLSSEAGMKWKLRKLYKSFNGIPDRAPVILQTPCSNLSANNHNNIAYELNAALSKEYLYQCQLNFTEFSFVVISCGKYRLFRVTMSMAVELLLLALLCGNFILTNSAAFSNCPSLTSIVTLPDFHTRIVGLP